MAAALPAAVEEMLRYEGPVHTVADAEAVTQAMADIRQQAVVGLDTETRPAFRKGERYLPSVVQVATAAASSA